MENLDRQSVRRAVLGLTGATCSSCAFAIEHFGRRLEGVEDIFVDASRGAVLVDYSGSDRVLGEIVEAVRRMGYDATIEDSGKVSNNS